MTTPHIFIVDAQTGKSTLRELNAQELEQLQKDQALEQAEASNQIATKEAKEAAQSKLEALGLTTDELKALGLGNN
jgi:hypothetical protein